MTIHRKVSLELQCDACQALGTRRAVTFTGRTALRLEARAFGWRYQYIKSIGRYGDLCLDCRKQEELL